MIKGLPPSKTPMKAKRTAIPKLVSDQVLKEYNHRCAICGEDRPQFHHIDEDRSNHDPLNLLPLCPNCHLNDQHNPTAKIDHGILSLFRIHRDPAILSPQFEPLYCRIKRLMSALHKTGHIDEKLEIADEIIQFMFCFGTMGGYYSSRFGMLLCYKRNFEDWCGTSAKRFFGLRLDVQRARLDQIMNLAVESLRYQSCTLPSKCSR